MIQSRHDDDNYIYELYDFNNGSLNFASKADLSSNHNISSIDKSTDISDDDKVIIPDTKIPVEPPKEDFTKSEHQNSFFLISNFTRRFKRLDFVVVYVSILILTILLILVLIFGEQRPWYKNLIKNNINPWLLRSLWVVATIISFGAFFFIWQDDRIIKNPRDLILSVLFIITGFLFLAWAVTLYYAENIAMSIWILLILFIYNFWLFMYLWYINPIAAIFLLPSLVLYIYLLYSTIHLASLNNIPI